MAGPPDTFVGSAHAAPCTTCFAGTYLAQAEVEFHYPRLQGVIVPGVIISQAVIPQVGITQVAIQWAIVPHEVPSHHAGGGIPRGDVQFSLSCGLDFL